MTALHAADPVKAEHPSLSTLVAPRPEAALPRPSRPQLYASVLLLLHEGRSHGWELVARLAELGVAVEPGAVYRVLRQMENEGLVRSGWVTSEQGPARRVYAVSGPGAARLHTLASDLAAERRALARLLRRYRRRFRTPPPSLTAV